MCNNKTITVSDQIEVEIVEYNGIYIHDTLQKTKLAIATEELNKLLQALIVSIEALENK